uniref:Peptide chain release factor domain-containing protein n=1 Tax=Kalanchoe fedtschenkoi TaxID=63787 RepID=A0A7N0ZWM0_KALFE
MAAQPVVLRICGSASARLVSSQCRSPVLKKQRPLRCSNLRATDDKSKVYKELGLFSLKKKIADAIFRAEMLAETALELEESKCIEQEEMIQENNLWDDLAGSSEIFVNLAGSTKLVDALKDLKYKAEEAKLITELAEIDAINYGLFKQAYEASVDVSKFLDQYEMAKLMKGQYDIEGASLIIKARNQSVYSEAWVKQLVNMYSKWAEKQGFKARIADMDSSASGGLKSATIDLEFQFAYGYLAGERGIHHMISSHNVNERVETGSLACSQSGYLFFKRKYHCWSSVLTDPLDLDHMLYC